MFGETNAVEVVGSVDDLSQQFAYLATGSHGLAIVDASDPLNPIAMGQLDLGGESTDVSISGSLNLAAVAAGDTGLHLVDVSDPMLPVLIETVEIAANRVEVFGPIAFVTSSTGLTSVDLSSGTVLQTLEIGDLTDVTRQGAFLYTMATDNEITIVEIAGLTMAERGALVLPQGNGRLFVGDNVAYATASDFDRGGIVTVDVSDPDAPTLISGSDVELPLVAPSTAFAANGTGLALLVGDPLDTSQLTVVDVSDPSNTSVADETFRTRINLPTSPQDVAIAGGIAFVANGVNGLQVVNYVEFDSLGIPPTVSLGANRCRRRSAIGWNPSLRRTGVAVDHGGDR